MAFAERRERERERKRERERERETFSALRCKLSTSICVFYYEIYCLVLYFNIFYFIFYAFLRFSLPIDRQCIINYKLGNFIREKTMEFTHF